MVTTGAGIIDFGGGGGVRPTRTDFDIADTRPPLSTKPNDTSSPTTVPLMPTLLQPLPPNES